MEALDDVEQIKAEDFIEKAWAAAASLWTSMAGGERRDLMLPRADANFQGVDELAPIQVPVETAPYRGRRPQPPASPKGAVQVSGLHTLAPLGAAAARSVRLGAA